MMTLLENPLNMHKIKKLFISCLQAFKHNFDISLLQKNQFKCNCAVALYMPCVFTVFSIQCFDLSSLIQHKLEGGLLALGQFQHALDELLAWMTHTEELLSEQRKAGGDPKAIEIELAKHHV